MKTKHPFYFEGQLDKWKMVVKYDLIAIRVNQDLPGPEEFSDHRDLGVMLDGSDRLDQQGSECVPVSVLQHKLLLI